MTATNSPERAHWFDDKRVEVYLFRINRRAIGGENALAYDREYPGLLEHAKAVLRLAPDYSYGRNGGRSWRVGNLQDGENFEYLAGRLGGERRGAVNKPRFDAELKSWSDESITETHAAVTAFTLMADSRILAVAAHPEISTATASNVLKGILNSGESLLSFPTTDWGVDPILNTVEFLDWIDRTPMVNSVKFVFARPNPDGADDLQAEMDRLDKLHAKSITEEITAADKEVGLDRGELKKDPEFKKQLSAAARSWSTITAQGKRDGEDVNYRQKTSVASERIKTRPRTWWDLTLGIVDAAIRGRKYLDERNPQGE